MNLIAAVVVAFTFLANLLIAFTVYRNNPKSWNNLLTAGLAIIFSLWTVFNFLALLPGSETTRIFWVRIVMFVTTPMGAATYLLAGVFPAEKITIRPLTKWVLTLLIIFISIFALSPYMFTRVENLPNGSFNLVPGPAIALFAVSHLGLTTFGLIILIKKYLKSQGLLRKQLLFFLLGTILTLTLITLTNFVAVVFFKAMQYTFIGPTFTLFQVGFITYAVIRHRLFDIKALIARSVTFTLLLIFVFGVIALSLAFTAQFITTGPQQIFITTGLILLVALSFRPLQRTFESLTKNIFYKQPYLSDKLLEKLGGIIRSNITINNLTKKILHQLNQTIQISSATFIINSKDNGQIIRSINDPKIPKLTYNTIHNLTSSASDNILIFDELPESPTKMVLRQNNISIVIPLKVKNTHHGLLLLEEKASGEAYTQQDINVLDILTPQLSVAIQNAKSYDEIKHFADTLKDEVDKATKDLKKANQNLRHLDKLKDEFVFIATHELKNPVTAMRGYLSMLQEGTFGHIPEKIHDPLDQMQASNQQLVDLVNDLLQIARSEAKTLTIKTEKVALCPTIDAIIGNVKPLYEQKGLTIEHKCTHSKLTVKADVNKLKEVINNLISNAIKYSQQGAIVINHESKDEQIITHVKDRGDGIPKKDHDKIFTRFFRVEEEAAKGIPGTGLGLFIVKQLVEKMGGKIWFVSTVGEGSTFNFSLPSN